MKTVAFYFKTGLEQLWKEKRCSAILILTATVTFVAIMVLFRIFFFNVESWEELQIKRCTYNFQFYEPKTEETAIDSKAALQWLTEGEELPNYSEIVNLRGRTIDYILTSYWENGEEIFVATQWIFNAVDTNIAMTQEIDITEGRYFLQEELETGKNVVLLSKPICEMEQSPYNVGDSLVLGNDTYIIVGFVSNMMHYMPLQTILQTNSMDVLFDTVRFSHSLNNTQITTLHNKFDSFCETIENQYDEEMEDFGGKVLSYLVSSLLLLGICAITLIRILSYLWISKQYEYAIYRQCGATNGQVRWILCLQIISFCLLSIILAIGIYQLFTPVLNYYEIGMG